MFGVIRLHDGVRVSRETRLGKSFRFSLPAVSRETGKRGILVVPRETGKPRWLCVSRETFETGIPSRHYPPLQFAIWFGRVRLWPR